MLGIADTSTIITISLIFSVVTMACPKLSLAQEPTEQQESVPTADLSVPTADLTVDELTPELKTLRSDIRRVLDTYYVRRLNTRDHNVWEVMHGLVGYGVDAQVDRGGPGARPVNSIGWICWNGSCGGERLFQVRDSKLIARQGYGVQGHDGQFLAILAQSRVKSDYPIRAAGQKFTVADLIRYEQHTCEAGAELTFKLIGLVHYLDSDATWKNNRGETWSVQRLIKEELAQPIHSAACGGTHRMAGFSYAVKKRRHREEPFTGEWERARKFVEAYHKYAWSLQNRDGSFSTNFLEGPGQSPDIDLRLESTGHVLEWLLLSLQDEELTDPRVTKATQYLTKLLGSQVNRRWEIGPLGHALHALTIYDQRMFGAQAGNRLNQLTNNTP